VASAVDVVATTSDRPPVLDDTALFGHPRGLGLLFITEMWERFSYYGMRAILILYLVQALHWDTARAAGLYGTYTMLVYLTPLVGGYLADRFIGTRRSLVIGGLIISAGHFTLAFPSMTTFYAGLALIIIGTGFFKPNVSTMVGQIYRDGDTRRDAGFTIFYIGINTGAAIGQIVTGYFAARPQYGWHWGFAAAGVGMLLGLIVYVTYRDKYLPGIGVRPAKTESAVASPGNATSASSSSMTALVHTGLGIAAGAVAGWMLGGGSWLALIVGATIGAALFVSVLGSHGDERRRVIAIFIVVAFATVFWAAYEQVGSSMNLFAANHTDLQIGSFTMPPAWLQSVNPIDILIFAPVFAWLWWALSRKGLEPSTALKMVLGLALLGTGFVFMVAGGRRADSGIVVSPFWLVAAYTFNTWGELCLSPVGLSYTTKVAPARFASLLMGVWFLSNAAANKIAGSLAAYTPTPGEAPTTAASGLAGYVQRMSTTNAGFFTIFVVASFSAAALMLLFVPLLKRLTASVKA